MFVIHSEIVRCQVKVLQFIEYSHFSIFKHNLKNYTTRYGLVSYTIEKLRKRAFCDICLDGDSFGHFFFADPNLKFSF